jgi:VanZ family protein
VSPSATTARALSLWLPVAAWAAFLFSLSSSATLPAPPPHVTDKMLHAAAYAVLAAAFARALAGARWDGVTPRVAVLAVIATTLYGLTDEFHQWFVPGRTVDAADLAADFTGATLAAALGLALRAIVERRRAAGTVERPAGRI